MFGIPMANLPSWRRLWRAAASLPESWRACRNRGGAVLCRSYEVFVRSAWRRISACSWHRTSLRDHRATTFRSYFTHRSKNLSLDDVVRKWTLPALRGWRPGNGKRRVAPCQVFKLAFAGIAGMIAIKLCRPRQLADCRRSAARPSSGCSAT